MASFTHTAWTDVPREQLSDTLARRFVSGDRLMLGHIELRKGCVVPVHQHENEQFSYVLRGALEYTVGAPGAEETLVVRAGEVIHLPANVPHGARALEDTVELDVFSPPRQDWVDGSDAYLRSVDAGASLAGDDEGPKPG